MDKCHYYLNNGLWKIVRTCYDYRKKEQNDFFWGMAVLPNYNSFGSHIVSTPWQQSWVTMDILESVNENLPDDARDENLDNEMRILRREVNFQYILRNYSSQPFVQQLFTAYSRIQTHAIVNYSEAEIKSFILKLKSLLKQLLSESPSAAHSLLRQMYKHNFLNVNCLETILSDINDESAFYCLLLYGLCRSETIGKHLPFVMGLSRSEYRYQLCLLLLASDNISCLKAMIQEDRKAFQNDSENKLKEFLDRGLEPLKNFSDMVLTERHFLFQILDLIQQHMDIFLSYNHHMVPSYVWPVVLLRCWNDESAPANMCPILIDKCKESSKDRTMLQIAFILEWYLNFKEWYGKHSEAVRGADASKSDLLSQAKEHSVLYLINNSTDLSETDWNQILELLKRGKSRADIVKSWDIILFDGYRVLIHVLHIILASAEISNLAKAQKGKLSEISALNDIFGSLYAEEVTGKLKLVKHMIKTMYPLNFRLEILENVFSLLFVQSDDVKRLSFAAKVSEGIVKVLQAKSKAAEKVGKFGKNYNLVHYPHSEKAADEEEEEEEQQQQPPPPRKGRSRGFVCKKFIARDLIYFVKECLVKFEEDLRSQADGAPRADVPCSIPVGQMENRLDRLYESVNEAIWRLQLVTDPAFASQIGVMHYPCGQDPFHYFDNEWIFLPHESDKNCLFKARKRSVEKTNNDSGSQSQSSTGNGNSGGESQSARRRISSRAAMNQMLASDSSLIIQCLAKGDVLNANHIIQTLNAEENKQTLEGELQFTESVNDLKKKLQNISLESPVKKYDAEGGGMTKSRSLQSIQMVANQGVTSTALTNHIERFLSVSTLPSIQGASKVSVGSMLQCIENAQAIVTIDLALTSDMTFQDFRALLNIASKHCPELSTRVQSPISAQTSFSKPLGYIIFSQNIIALLQEVNKSNVTESDAEISLNQFLRCHQFPFSLKSLKDSIGFWKQLKSAYAEFEKCDGESAVTAIGKEGKYQRNIKEMQKVFENAKKLVESCGDFLDLGKGDSSGSAGEMSKSINYSDLLSRYLTDLASFILENIPPKSDMLEAVSFRGLLEQSAVDIVDRLIFDYRIEPSVLEKKAQQLGFNLSASLVAGCCPRLPQNGFVGEGAKCPPADRIVLNELIPDYKSTEQRNPAEVVESTFSELLIAFQNYSRNKIVESENGAEGGRNLLTESDIVELRNDFKIQSILEKTLQLNFASFDGVGDRGGLTFFANLLNLMLCHCYLSTKLDDTDGVYSRHSLNRSLGYVFIGYNLGELGFVSIFDVRSRILGRGDDSLFSLGANPGWEGVNLAGDPRMAFAIAEFRSTSPRLQFYSDVDAQMDEIVSSYVGNFMSVSDGRIVITDVIDSYASHLGEDGMKTLLEFASANEHLHQDISDLTVEVRSPAKELSLSLDYDSGCGREGAPVEESEPEKWRDRSLSDSILRHLSQSSRVLADIVQKVHEAKEPAQTEVARDVLTEEKLKFLDLLLGAPWFAPIVPLFDNNPVIAALSKCPAESRLNAFFEDCVLNKDWFKCLDVLFALPDYYVLSSLNLKRLKDVVLREITLATSRNDEEHPWYYSQHICDIHMRLETVKTCSKYWSGSVCIAQLSSILYDYPNLSSDLAEEVRSMVRKIRVYNSISETVPEYMEMSWHDVYSSIEQSPHVVLQNLIKANQLELCLQWINLPGILSSIQQYIDSEFVLLFFNMLSNDFELIDQLLNSLPASTLSSVCDSVVYKLKSVPLVSYLVQLLLRINPSPKYETLAFGVRLVSDLSPEEQSELVHLMSHPLLIVEQLLMNTRLDALECILKKMRDEGNTGLINNAEVNKLIASYASKAMEFDLIKTVKNTEVRQSFLVEARPQAQSEFTVPAEVPDKSQWIPDNQVSLCMCCLMVTFSMFNRRHHCRRCGRVVCSTCSPHQLKVQGYRGVAVRVCHRCYAFHTKLEGDSKCSVSADASNASNLSRDVRRWKLSTDSVRNATIRDEFSFEHVPNVSLCLAIFNLLPDAAYSSVLLDESEKLLKLLQLNGKSGNPEVDCGVMIQIIRSLVVGAKVKYGQAGLAMGVASCDRLLGHVDLLHLLIKNHCSRLIPAEPLDGHTLRYLRDRLVQEELWDLAIEVSTKSGLDRNGVWAAWGKVCLAAGAWDEARAKFAYCLDSASKPAKNPPLVDEICRILESSSTFVGFKQASKTPDKSVAAEEVGQVLSNLKWLAQGKPLSFSASSAKNSVHYAEQIHYLSTYGSHQGLLSFYLKHEEWKSALNYFLEQQLNPDVFVEAILMPSFKSDQQNRLKSEILAVDSTLESFKKYLCHACLYLQKSDHLHILYEMQLLMQDFVRAAATCIRLYQRYSSSYTELVSRSSYLHTALRHLEEEMSLLSKKMKRLDCIMKLEPKEVNKHMNTIWRQLEVAKFLGGCEAEGKFIRNYFPEYVSRGREMATLFDGNAERIILAALIILSGKNIPEGFGIAYRIIQDYQLDPGEIYLTAGKRLAECRRLADMEALIECVKTSGADGVASVVDHVLGVCLPLVARSGEVLQEFDNLIKHITNVDLKISVLIDSRRLKSAYLLAVRHNRLTEVQRIMELADQMGQIVLKKICMKKLGQSPEGSICSSIPSTDDGL